MVIINNGNNYNDGARIDDDDDDDDGMEAWSYLFTKELLIHKYEPNQMAYSSYTRELSSHLSIKEDMHSWAHRNLVSNHVEEGQSWLQEQVIYAIIMHQAPKISILGLSSVVSILKFFILFKQGALHFHLGLANYVVCPGRDQA